MNILKKIELSTAFVAYLFSSLAFSAESSAQQYLGRWSVSCDTPVILSIDKEKSAILTVNSNQIYIEVAYRAASGGGLDIFYVQPEELGPGGSEIDWDDISTLEKIGSFTMVDNKMANFSWFGFLNKKTGKRILVKGPEFVAATSQIKLLNCN